MDQALSLHIGLMARIETRNLSDEGRDNLALLDRTWRQWDQAATAFERAAEAEDFQAVAMRCRELLITFVSELEIPKRTGLQPDFKKADVKNQLKWLFEHKLPGRSHRRMRKYIESMTDQTWDMAAALTHKKSVRHDDIDFLLDAVHHLCITCYRALIFVNPSAPDRCPDCESYQLYEEFRPEFIDTPNAVIRNLCEVCGWSNIQDEMM